MTEQPSWAGHVPSYSGVRGPLPPPQWDEVSQNTLDDLRLRLRESITESILLALRGFFLPGPLGTAFDQLVEWASMLLDAEAFLSAIQGEYEGDNFVLQAIQLLFFPFRLFIEPLAVWLSWLWKLFANIEPNPPPTGPGADLLVPIFTLIDTVWDMFTTAAGNLLEDFFYFLNWLWRLFTNTPGENPDPTGPAAFILVPLFKLIDTVWDMFTTATGNLLEDFFYFFNWMWRLFTNAPGENPEPTGPAAFILVPLFKLIDTVWDTFTYAFGNLLEDLFYFLNWLWRLFTNTPGENPEPTGPAAFILVPLFKFIDSVWEMFTAAAGNLLEDLFYFLNWLWRLFTNTPGENPDPTGPAAFILVPLFKWLDGLWEAFGDVVEDVFAFIMNVFKPMALTFNGDIVGTIIKQVVEFFNGIINTFGSIAQGVPSFNDLGQTLLNLINSITGGFAATIANGIAAVLDLFSRIPILKALIDTFIPPEWRNSVAQPASSLADLKSYATTLLKTDSVLYAQNLYGQVAPDQLPPTGAGDVADYKPNYVADPSFKSAAAVQAGEGWSWDAATSRTVGDGGSAKLAGDGGVKQMFSNLVAVSPGQEIEVSVYAKWTKPSAARPTISVGLRAYNGDAVLPSVGTVASQSNVVTDSGWVQLKGTYAIPTTTAMTHVRLSLSVLNAPSGTSVWFDEASLRKVSLIRPSLVGGVGTTSDTLADDIENAVGVEQYQELLNKIAGTTGATVDDVKNTIEDFLDGNSEISGDQIKKGNIASTYINELISTWNKINGSISGPTTLADGTIDSAFAALTAFREQFSGNGTRINEAVSASNSAVGRVAILEKSYKELYDYATSAGKDARAAAIKVGLVPETPVNPPSTPIIQFREANDSFNRTSLGSAWTTDRKFNNLAAFVLDGNNVRFKAADITTVDSIGAAVHTGGGGLTEYQRVYAVLGSSPSVPGLGSPGYNDLIGRAASATSCIVARFYGNNIVRLFYRSAAWEVWPWEPGRGGAGLGTDSNAATFGTFSLPAGVTVSSGAMIELYVGNKSISDQTKCSVRVGSWTSTAATIPASVMSVLGKGWGFGGGNGISIAAAQQSALFDSWGAQDQV